MKRILSTCMFLILIFALVACSNDKDDVNDKEGSSNDDKEVTVTIASWALGSEGEANIDRLMIERFEEAFPHIKVEIDESIDPEDWNGSLSAAASASSMPDVFSLAQIPTGLANDWLLDLTELTSKDDDFASVPESVKEAVAHNEGTYALPSGQHFLGYFVNKDLFEQANLTAPELGMDIDEFTDAVRDVTDVNSGVAGLNHPFSVAEWYPASVNEELGWFTYQDGKFQIDSDDFISGVHFANSLITNDYTYETLSEDQQAQFNGENPEEVWLNGGVGIKWDGSWITGHLSAESDFDWDFIGIPGDRVVITHDYYGVSSSTEHEEAAYELAKWMSFSSDGFLERMAISDETEGVDLASFPVTADEEVLDEFFSRIDAPGLIEAYEKLDDAIIEPVKVVPGFAQSRWEAPTGIAVGEEPNANVAALIDAAVRGELNIEDYVSQINDLANQKYEEGLEAINK